MTEIDATPRRHSLGRALALLEHVADAGTPLGLSNLSEASELPLATTHRMARVLASAGYLHQGPDRRYGLGPRLVALGGVALRPVAEMAGWLEHLVETTGETANAATLCGESVLYVAEVASPHLVRASTPVHHQTMVHCSAPGKALLSLLPDEEIVGILQRAGLPRRTEHTLCSVPEVLDAVHQVRHRGYAVDDEENEIGARCVALPVSDAPFPLAISVCGLTGRVGLADAPGLAAELRSVIDRVPM